MPYRLSALAERDLEEIWSYVAEGASPATADRLIDAIVDRTGRSSTSWTTRPDGGVVAARPSLLGGDSEPRI